MEERTFYKTKHQEAEIVYNKNYGWTIVGFNSKYVFPKYMKYTILIGFKSFDETENFFNKYLKI